MNPMSITFVNHTIQLADQYLENFPIQEEEDLDRIKVALKILLEKNEVVETKTEIKQQVSLIKEVIDAPEMYAPLDQCAQFKKIILERVALKIKRIECLSPEGKKENLEYAKERKEVISNNQEIMENVPPRDQGPRDYTLTPEEEVDIYEEFEALRNLNAQRLRDEVDTVLDITHEVNYPAVGPAPYVYYDQNRVVNSDIPVTGFTGTLWEPRMDRLGGGVYIRNNSGNNPSREWMQNIFRTTIQQFFNERNDSDPESSGEEYSN